jgi:hypothetical protein
MINTEGLPMPGPSPESLEARLRALPQPSAPEGLEARLLATVSTTMPTSRRRWSSLVLATGLAAAGCIVAVFVWHREFRQRSSGATQIATPAPPNLHPAVSRGTSLAALRGDPSLIDETSVPSFTWPLDERETPRGLSPIPASLLD